MQAKVSSSDEAHGTTIAGNVDETEGAEPRESSARNDFVMFTILFRPNQAEAVISFKFFEVILTSVCYSLLIASDKSSLKRPTDLCLLNLCTWNQKQNDFNGSHVQSRRWFGAENGSSEWM